MDLSIIIPCYNEVDNVPKLKQELLPVVLQLAEGQSVELIFVDDGSVDGTREALVGAFQDDTLPQVSVRIERHDVNRGLGAALRTGFASARGQVVLTTDSDGTYEFSGIPGLLSCLTPGVDMVTASPYHPDGGVLDVPAYRLLLSRGSSMMYRVLVERRIYTYTCLFRAYRSQVVKNVQFESDGFLAGTEILVNGMLMGHSVAEYPAVLHSRVAGTSKAKIMRTILAHLGYQARILTYRVRGRHGVAVGSSLAD
jgi:dolichol-phosphate mannosyltransferase